MRFRYSGFLVVPALLLGLSLWSFQADGYDSYHPSDDDGCFQCHPGFLTPDQSGRGPLHQDVHVGSSNMGGSCTYCHGSTGDNPKTWVSGTYDGVGTTPEYSCNGCHEGTGLRAHHAAANAPADNDGLFCVDCHDSDGTPPPEGTVPFYYTLGNVNVNDPCVVATGSGGEDYDGDGKGLDNDGDLLYEQDDPNACNPVPAVPSTWGVIKSRYVTAS